jgi:AcrR family transcriptional regulator
MNSSSNPKRDLILSTGKDLFWKFGFRRVTVEEICAKAGISKMTFYKYFSNKMDLVKTLMDGILRESLDVYHSINSSDISYPEKVIRMIQLKKDQIKSMSNEFFRDYIQSDDPELTAYLNKLTQDNLKAFTDDFYRAQKNGDIRQDLKVEFIMYIMNHLINLTQDDNLLNLYDNPQDLVMEITNFLFYGILNREVHH